MFSQIIGQNSYLKDAVDEEDALVLACRRGDINVVQKLLSNLSYINHHYYHDYPLIMACHSGNLDLVKYLWPLYPNIDIDSVGKCFNASARQCHIQIASFIANKTKLTHKTMRDTFIDTCRINCLQLTQFIINKYKRSLDHTFIRSGLAISLIRGHVKITEILMKFVDDTNAYCEFMYSIIDGHLHTVQYLTPKCRNLSINDHTQVFLSACTNGHFDTVVWLKTTWPEIDHRVNNDEAFINAFVKNGHSSKFINDQSRLQLLRWFLIQSPDFDYVSDGTYFKQLCINGYIECAKYFYNLAPQIINSIDANELFGSVCSTKFLDLAKWLTQILDLNNLNTLKCFIDSCNYSNIQIVQWLYSMYPQVADESNAKIILSSINVCTNIEIIKFVIKFWPNIKSYLFCQSYFDRHNFMFKNHKSYKCMNIMKYICGLYLDSELTNVINLLYKYQHYNLILYLAENRDLSYVVIKTEYSDEFIKLMDSIDRGAVVKSARS